MQVKFLGHSTFEVDVAGKKILFDPFISPNEKAKDIDAGLLKPDYMLLSHGHEDHVADAVKIAKQSNCTVVSNYEIVSWLGEKGIKNVHPMNFGGNKQFDFGNVKYVYAAHSSVLPDGTYGGNPGGFIVDSEEGNFYYAGDTALTYEMKLIGEFHQLDFAFLPIGDNFTMGAEEAVRAAQFINCKKIIGMHYDTFGYIEIDHNKTKQIFSDNGIELILMDIGNSITI